MNTLHLQLGLLQRPRIGISQCLSGARVRYDGRDKFHQASQGWLADLFELQPFCPEMAIGLPAPRPPIKLIQTANEINVIEPHSQANYTQALSEVAQGLIQHNQLCGFVLTTKSPSCGLGTTKVYNQADELIGLSNGIFANTLAHSERNLALIEDIDLEDKHKKLAFITGVYQRQCQLEQGDWALLNARLALHLKTSQELIELIG